MHLYPNNLTFLPQHQQESYNLIRFLQPKAYLGRLGIILLGVLVHTYIQMFTMLSYSQVPLAVLLFKVQHTYTRPI